MEMVFKITFQIFISHSKGKIKAALTVAGGMKFRLIPLGPQPFSTWWPLQSFLRFQRKQFDNQLPLGTVFSIPVPCGVILSLQLDNKHLESKGCPSYIHCIFHSNKLRTSPFSILPSPPIHSHPQNKHLRVLVLNFQPQAIPHHPSCREHPRRLSHLTSPRSPGYIATHLVGQHTKEANDVGHMAARRLDLQKDTGPHSGYSETPCVLQDSDVSFQGSQTMVLWVRHPCANPEQMTQGSHASAVLKSRALLRFSWAPKALQTVTSARKLKRHLLLGRKAMTNLDSVLKSRDITFLTKVHIIKAMVFSVVMYRCETWTIKKVSTEELMLSNCGTGEDS